MTHPEPAPLLDPAFDRASFYDEADDPDAPDFWDGYPAARTLSPAPRGWGMIEVEPH